MNLSPVIPQDEFLWRGVFSRRRSKGPTVKARDFLEKPSVRRLSVERLDNAPQAEIDRIAKAVAVNRHTSLKRWAKVKAEHAREDGRDVEYTPVEGNPYHADIVLPELSGDEKADRRMQAFHAKKLADNAIWSDR